MVWRSACGLSGRRYAARIAVRQRGLWAEIARKHKLVEGDLGVLASAWHTDADLGRPIEVLTDMSKSRKLGFLEYQATDDSFFDLFSRLREEHLIP